VMSGSRVRRTLSALGVSVLTVAVAAGCGGRADSTSLGNAVHPTTSTTPSTIAQSPAASASTPPAHPYAMSVYFVGHAGGLVSRKVRVEAHANVFEEALAIAGAPPPEARLSNAFPADAFGSVSFDGFGSHGKYGVVLRDDAVEHAQPGMSPADARLAIRAVVCTVQTGKFAPVMFYLHRRAATGLFGVPLKDGTVSAARCSR